MPDPTVRSVLTKTPATTNPFLVTKPPDLLTGDLLVIAVQIWGGAVATPAGWTLYGPATANTNDHGYFFTKIADETDTVATNIASISHDGVKVVATCWAVQDASGIERVVIGATTNTDPTIIDEGFTPALANDLILMTAQGTGSTAATFFTANNNPIWITDFHGLGSNYITNRHATYAYNTPTGNIGINVANQKAAGYIAISGLFIEPTPPPEPIQGTNGTKLIENSTFAVDLAKWSASGSQDFELSNPPWPGVFSQSDLPIPTPNDITTGLHYVSDGDETQVYYPCVYRIGPTVVRKPKIYKANLWLYKASDVTHGSRMEITFYDSNYNPIANDLHNIEGIYNSWAYIPIQRIPPPDAEYITLSLSMPRFQGVNLYITDVNLSPYYGDLMIDSMWS